MGKSSALQQDDSRTQTTVVGKYFEDRDVRDGLAAIICKFTPRQIARGSGGSIDAAKKWIEKDRTANTAHTINMARSFPAVSQWLADQVGWRAAQAISADAVIRWAREFRAADGLEGDVARAVLRAVAGDPAPKIEPETLTQSADVIDLRERRMALDVWPSTYSPDGAADDLLKRIA